MAFAFLIPTLVFARQIMLSGTVNNVSGNNISFTAKNSTSYTADATNSKLVSRFGATIGISDIKNGDTIWLYGVASSTNITPSLVRDTSIPTKIGETAVNITCVGSAVSTRESALDGAMTTYTQAINAAYSARATALQQAYANSDPTQVKSAVKTAWSNFRTALKNARNAWRTSKNSAWSVFRTAAKACNASGSISDSINVYSEAIGQ